MTAFDLLLFAQTGFPSQPPNFNPPPSTGDVGGAIATFFLVLACTGIVGLLVPVLLTICVWKIFTKADQPGWASLVPIYNIIVMWQIFEKADEPGGAVIVPVYNMIVLAKVFGKEIGFAMGLFFLPFIFFPMLAFGSAEFVGASRRCKPKRHRDEEDSQFSPETALPKRPLVGRESRFSPETVFWNGTGASMPEQLGRYRVKRKLGDGGMGDVYLVENTALRREEALKVPHFESGSDAVVRERFLREARAAARLDHPNLCPIYDVGVIDGIYFLTMRLLQGKPLSAYTKQAQPPRQAVKIVVKLAQALEHAHTRGVVHRDLKPGNVMMCAEAGPIVLDFGLAKQTQQFDEKLTQTGTMMGTPAYMPPEQVKGELHRIGPASDVYSLGVILFELLTGRLPFEGSQAEVLGKILYAGAPLPSQLCPEVGSALDAICRKAMAKAPENRYPSMKAFAAALTDVLRTFPPTASAQPPVAAPDAGDILALPTEVPKPAPARRPSDRKLSQ